MWLYQNSHTSETHRFRELGCNKTFPFFSPPKPIDHSQWMKASAPNCKSRVLQGEICRCSCRKRWRVRTNWFRVSWASPKNPWWGWMSGPKMWFRSGRLPLSKDGRHHPRASPWWEMQTWVCSLTPPPHHHQFCVGESVCHIWSPPCGCLQDFGEYQESYYSVQTTEGEQISQLIAGYIDIILKKVMQTHSHIHTRQSFCVPGNSTDLWTPTDTQILHGSLSSRCARDLLSLHTSHFISAFWLPRRWGAIYFTSEHPSKDFV